MNTIRLCPGCGAPLTSDAPGGLCPQCLLRTQGGTALDGFEPQAARPIPVPGGVFGGYRILKLLGHGGMGEVYEAEQLDSGRRVALKVMRHTLASEEDRKRFLREGRLAASVNHPNVVYIHRSEEIDGAPAISMELVHGGTLKDRLKSDGPLPISQAVEAALQIVDGLEAAQSAGVLHRDIKPANCFVSVDGVVKVGDFGLSVSTLARGESLITATGAVMGTPAYASPEQLRGEELDVRSDIYSVGATLYHLLTGRTPFTATDFVKLITEVLDKNPAPPRSLRADIPAELSKILLRCLAKDRADRYQGYTELRDALLPFRAAEVAPGRPGVRFLADLLDGSIAYAPSLVFLIYWSYDPLDQFVRERTLSAGVIAAALYAVQFLYYALAEGIWGAGLGKMILGLRVVGMDGQPPGVLRALLRIAVYLAPSILPPLLLFLFVSGAELRSARDNEEWIVTDWLWILLHAGLFVTMRRRNGYAGIHDLLSQTRVIVRPRTQSRPALFARPLPPAIPTPAGSPPIGPYQIEATLWQRDGEELLLGVDPALRRRVWVHRRHSGSPRTPNRRHDLSRPARLRWLSDGASESAVWDVYEAPDGVSFTEATASPQPWDAVRFWLHDLAGECTALLDERDGDAVLGLDRIWITSGGRALLLDFTGTGAEQSSTTIDLPAVQTFLSAVARRALRGSPEARDSVEFNALPLAAAAFIDSLERQGFSEPRMIVGNLESLLAKPAEVTRNRRAASIALMPVIFLGLGLIAAAMFAFDRYRKEKSWNAAFPGEPSPALLGAALVNARAELNTTTMDEIRDFEIFLVNKYGHLMTNGLVWNDPKLKTALADTDERDFRAMVRKVTAEGAGLTRDAERAGEERLDMERRTQRAEPLWVLWAVLVCGFGVFAFMEFAGCLAARTSPVLQLFGIAVVDRAGRKATRLRLFIRTAVVWLALGIVGGVLAVFAAVIVAAFTGSFMGEARETVGPGFAMVAWVIVVVTLGVLGFLTAYAIRHPARGLQDRIAGTALVPR